MGKDYAMPITNLTYFDATPSQIKDGVTNLSDPSEIRELLTFSDIPTKEEIRDRAERIAIIAVQAGNEKAMIGGAPYLMSALEEELEERGIDPVYSFSKRESKNITNTDGSVTKQNVFRHLGFINVGDIMITDHKSKAEVTKDGILNLTQHDATDSQVFAGVREPVDKESIRSELTFNDSPTLDDIEARANSIADKAAAEGYKKAMIGGAPYLMSALETALSARGIEPIYAFSERNVRAKGNPDGSVSKQVTFEHKGFVSIEPKPAYHLESIEPVKEALHRILEDHEHWLNQDCEGWEHMRADLSGANLSRADLSGENLRGVDLHGAKLRGVNLHGGDLSCTDLRGADLVEAKLDRADLSGADLTGANLERTDFYKANLEGAILKDADLREAEIEKANLRGADLSKANLVKADLSGANLEGANLYNASMTQAKLEGGSLICANLRMACLRAANLNRTKLNGADFQEANLGGADMNHAYMLVHGAVRKEKPNFSGAYMKDVELHDADLKGADLHGADLGGADLERADFYKANLGYAYLRGADLHEADMDKADLHEADLHGANLESADLSGADLTHANLDYANLKFADLHGSCLETASLRSAQMVAVDLVGANVKDADLRDACLRGADLHEADLENTNLQGANLDNANLRGTDMDKTDASERPSPTLR